MTEHSARHTALLLAMGIDVWVPRREFAPVNLGDMTLAARAVAGDARAIATSSSPVRARTARVEADRGRQPAGLPDGRSGSDAHAATPTATPTQTQRTKLDAPDVPEFELVQLQLWRTHRALLLAEAGVRAQPRLLADLQRAIDGLEPPASLEHLPAFEWPPVGRPELANRSSMQSAWRALVQRVRRERPLELFVTFGDAGSGALARIVTLDIESSRPGSADRVPWLHAPGLDALHSSPQAKQALWRQLSALP